MKAKEYPIGATAEWQGVTLTKQSQAEAGENVNPEIWTTPNGFEYEPSLEFQTGQSDPAFNPLQAAQ